ncbi:MAG: hypothetical protein ACJ0HZ_06490 [Woeseiaceae bacterium]|tara:strand:- start:1471 stop:1668 length:198 start_codon:yes stop_codon:yes gene_type:complete
MKSFEEQFYLENPSRYQIIKRDVRLFFWLLKRALMWLGKGLLIRIAYKKAKNSGKPLVIEEVIRD